MKKKNIYQKNLMTVTPFSKMLAGILFILLIFGAFFLGIKYNKQTTIREKSITNSNTK